MRGWKGIIAAGVACLLISSSTCYAGTIYACRKKVGGTIRIVSAKTVCLATETKMSWNTVGPQGPQGPQGMVGYACWDDNGSGGCDLETEDLNQDGVCSITDCRMPIIRSGANYEHANVAGSDFSHVDLSGATFQYANAGAVNFSNATLVGVNFNYANLGGANFTGANTYGATWIGTTCPSGALSSGSPRTCGY